MAGEMGNFTRRSILRTGWKVAAGAGLIRLTEPLARSAITGNTAERIVVCIYLLGGNDGNNMVLQSSQYAKYVQGRGDLALPQGDFSVTQRDTSSGEVGFHPSMVQMRELFELGSLAVIADVGIVQPSFTRGPVVGNSRTAIPTSSSASDLIYIPDGYFGPTWAAGIAGIKNLDPEKKSITGFNTPASDVATKTTTSLALFAQSAANERAKILEQASSSKTNFQTPFPASGIGQELLQVARLIASGATSGMRPQVFFAVQSGYDTRTDQLARQAARLAELSAAMYAFYQATAEMGVARQVTTYTDSDFGRTLKPNGKGGSEQGWGSHYLVMGGSVLGGKVYGQFPDLTLGGQDDATGSGVWAPAVAKQQYEATFASWLGVSNALPALSLSGPVLDFLV